MKQDLIKLGFSSNEADVYLAMIEIGNTGAGEIIKKTSLHRNIVYETLDKLISKKFVTKVTKKNVAQFLLNDPDRILEAQKQKLELATKLVPSLVAKGNVKQEIVIYEGLEGFQTFSQDYIDKMKKNTTLYILGSTGDLWFELMGEKLYKYEKTRLGKNIYWKIVGYHESKKDIEQMRSGKLCHLRVIQENIKTPASVLIWDDYIALQSLIEPYSVIQIKNANLANAYLNYFNLLWEQGKDI